MLTSFHEGTFVTGQSCFVDALKFKTESFFLAATMRTTHSWSEKRCITLVRVHYSSRSIPFLSITDLANLLFDKAFVGSFHYLVFEAQWWAHALSWKRLSLNSIVILAQVHWSFDWDSFLFARCTGFLLPDVRNFLFVIRYGQDEI